MDRLLDHVDRDGLPLRRELCPLVRAMSDGVARWEAVRWRRKDGNRQPVIVQAIRVRAEDGDVVGAVELFQSEQGAAGGSDTQPGVGRQRSS